MVLDIIMKDKEYQVIIERGILNKASSVLGFDKKTSKILIVTDDGIPVQYIDTLKNNIINTNSNKYKGDIYIDRYSLISSSLLPPIIAVNGRPGFCIKKVKFLTSFSIKKPKYLSFGKSCAIVAVLLCSRWAAPKASLI